MHLLPLACLALLIPPPAVDVVYIRGQGRDVPRQVYVQRLPGGAPREVTRPGGPFYGEVHLGAFSPDSSKLLLTYPRGPTGGPEMWLLDVPRAALTRLDTGGHALVDPKWSPNGRYLASPSSMPVAIGGDPKSRIVLIDTTTRKTSEIGLGSAGDVCAIAWMPDSTGLVLGRIPGRLLLLLRDRKLKHLKPTGPPYVSFENVMPQPYDPSPDGKLVVVHPSYVKWKVGPPLQVLSVGGRLSRVPLPDKGDPGRAVWSPDSKRLALCCTTCYGCDEPAPSPVYSGTVYSVDVGSRKVHRLYGPTFPSRSAVPSVAGWSGDGQWVIVHDLNDDGPSGKIGSRHIFIAYRWNGATACELGAVEDADEVVTAAR